MPPVQNLMTKRKSLATKPPSPSVSTPGRAGQPDTPADAISRHLPSPAAIRETIESVVIAFVLAFLVRTFEAEAFVIPTGSMAPTLMGRHKDLVCPKCGCSYQVNAHDEVDAEGELKGRQYQIVAGVCPMCRYTAQLDDDNPKHVSYPSYNGDRILVSKFAYELADPQRWDVIVFKFPGDATTDARTNFIKRLVGLPGETVRIQRGDLWIRRGQEPFRIARKPPEKLWAMLQPVFDNDYMPRIAEYGWPRAGSPNRPPTAARRGHGVPTTIRRFTPTAQPPASAGFAIAISCRPIGSGKPPPTSASIRRRTSHRSSSKTSPPTTPAGFALRCQVEETTA